MKKKDYTIETLLFCLLLAILGSMVSCSPKIEVSGTAIEKYRGEKAVTTTFKTVSGGIFLKRGFVYNTYELGKVYECRINKNQLFTEIK